MHAAIARGPLGRTAKPRSCIASPSHAGNQLHTLASAGNLGGTAVHLDSRGHDFGGGGDREVACMAPFADSRLMEGPMKMLVAKGASRCAAGGKTHDKWRCSSCRVHGLNCQWLASADIAKTLAGTRAPGGG